GWYIVLSHRIPPQHALAAVDGWGGDAFIVARERGKTCVRDVYVGDTPRDTLEFAGALDEWRRALPAGTVKVDRRGPNALFVRSCDPGETAAVTEGTGGDLFLPPFRTGIMLALIQQGA